MLDGKERMFFYMRKEFLRWEERMFFYMRKEFVRWEENRECREL